jgi:hypothetical protein
MPKQRKTTGEPIPSGIVIPRFHGTISFPREIFEEALDKLLSKQAAAAKRAAAKAEKVVARKKRRGRK